MIDPRQLRDLIVRPVLERLGLYSLAAEQLVMGTAAKESLLVYIRQHLGEGKHGRGRGLWQVEPKTAEDLIVRNTGRLVEARLIPLDFDRSGELEGDLYLGAALCRLKYLDAPEKLPAAGDVAGMASYWKRFYNTVKGKGKPEEFVASWKACNLDRLYGG